MGCKNQIIRYKKPPYGGTVLSPVIDDRTENREFSSAIFNITNIQTRIKDYAWTDYNLLPAAYG